MNKGILLDRDETLIVDKGFTYKTEDLLWKPDAINCMSLFNSLGFKLIIITNQSGIAMGHYEKQDMHTFHKFMNLDIYRKTGVNFDSFYYCPHHPDAKLQEFRKICKCRKPGDSLYKKALVDFSLDPTQSFAIGDRLTDLIPAFNNGIRKGFLLSSGRSVEKSSYNSEKSKLVKVSNWKEIIDNLSYI